MSTLPIIIAMNSLLSSLVIACNVFELISSNFEIEVSKTKKNVKI